MIHEFEGVALPILDFSINFDLGLMFVLCQKTKILGLVNQNQQSQGALECWIQKEEVFKREWVHSFSKLPTCFHHQDNTVVIGFEDGTCFAILVNFNFDISSEKQINQHSSKVMGLHLQNDRLHSISNDEYKVFSLHKNESILSQQLKELNSLLVAQDRSFVSDQGGIVYVFEITQIKVQLLLKIETQIENIKGMCKSNNKLYCVGTQGTICIIETETYTICSKAKGRIQSKEIACSEMRKLFFIGNKDGTLTAFDDQDFAPIYQIKAHSDSISRIINFENENLLLTASNDKYIRVAIIYKQRPGEFQYNKLIFRFNRFEKNYMFIFILLNLSLALPDYYHQFDEINLGKYSDCVKIETLIENPKIDILTINEEAPFKAFLMFGEHARELISPETGLHLLDSICNKKYDVSKYQIKMILNLNPLSRMRVENGEYCLRLNENNVDLNRNYDAHFKQYEDNELQTNSGPKPFSEPETQAVRDLLKSYHPNMYLSIHSGSAGLYTPHAYSMDEPENYEQLMKVLNVIKEDHCPMCETGMSSKNVGYLAYGSAMDYVYDEIGVKNSFLFEIYHKDVNIINDLRIEHLKKDKVSFLQNDETPEECFDYFNPKDEETYNWYIQNWSDAIIKTIDLVQKNQEDVRLSHN